MSAKHPTPWTFSAEDEFEDTPVLDSNGDWVLVRDSGVYPPDLDTCREIVEAVNESDRLEQKHADEIAKLLAQREKLYKELGNASDAAIRAIRERDRLRDIMRGLVAILETITLEDHEIELLDEAREALGEGEA